MDQWRNRIVGEGVKPANQFLANPLNFRRHPNAQRNALRGVLSEVGWVQRVIENQRTGNLIDGHARIEEALSRDENEPVPYVAVDLSESEERLILATLDPLAALAVADKESLDLLLKEVSTGEAAVQEMLSNLAQDNGLYFGEKKEEDESAVGEMIDRAAELQKKWKVKRGQVWEIGRHRLMCGDSTSSEDVARLMGEQKADICFTSPPYGQQRDYEKGVADWEKLMRGVFALIPYHDETQVLVNLGLIHNEGEWQPYWEPWLEWMRSQGWRRFGWYVWDQGFGLPGDWNGRFAPSHEFIFHFNRRSKRPEKSVETKPESLKRAQQKKKSVAAGRKEWVLRGKDGVVKEINSVDACGQLVKIPDSVVRIGRESARGDHTKVHPAVFPVGLPSFMLRCWPGIAYEPFCGSGTGLVAAEQEGQVGYGMDTSEAYCAVTLERMSNLGLEPRLLND